MRFFFKALCMSLSLVLPACSTSGDGASSLPSSSEATSESSLDRTASSQAIQTYTITWVDSSGRVLEKDENVPSGTMPSYDGDIPTKEEEEGYVYSFRGWYPEPYAVDKDQRYVAQYDRTKLIYHIAYTLNGGVNSPDNPSSYRIGTSFTFLPAAKTGYSFVGWFWSSGVQIIEITPETTGDLYLNARWSALKNTLSVTSDNTEQGSVAVISGEGYSGESITVKASPELGYKFDGWYYGSNRVSGDATYTFTMPTSDYALVGKFLYDEDYAKDHGIIPVFSSDQTTVTYGLYPNKNVTDATLLSSLNALTTPEENGYYLYEGDYYAKTVAKPYKSNYTFKNGTSIVSGTTYWFACDPIQWDVLENSNGDYYLLTSNIIDAGYYYNAQENRIIDGRWVYPNNYKYSDIRAWLNGYDGSDYDAGDYSNDNFVDAAFGLGDDYVIPKVVDNSSNTTNNPANSFYCENTIDAVFLPSYQDYIDPDYGFPATSNTDDSRECVPTDYAKARGACYQTKFSPRAGSYWTRSPDTYRNQEYTVWILNDFGGIGFDAVDWDGEGVRPAIHLQVSD